ncbi:MAG: amidohydrolase family protein [Bacillota bacterium]
MGIDVHNHFYPGAYLKALHTGQFRAELSDGHGTDPILSYAGDYNILVPGHRRLEARMADMEEAGIKAHILSLTTPGVHIEEPSAGIELARAVNEDFAAICRDHPGQFFAFAALPLQDPEAAADELRHAVSSLGLAGATLFTNVDGHNLDHPSFAPVFATAEELGAVLFIHPTSPDQHGALADYRLVPLLGFLFDTTTAISRLIFAGVLERHPNLRIIASHLGGTLPYVAERLDRGYRVYPEICDLIPGPPSSYLARIYYDTVAFDPSALQFVRGTSGAGRMLLGSDYPHQIGDMKRALAAVRDMEVTSEERHQITKGNARRLLGTAGSSGT